MMERSEKMDKVIMQLNNGLLYIAQAVLIVMVIIVTFDVIGRWFFGHPITGSVEITELGLSMVIFLSIAYTHLKREHITIDFLVDKFPVKVQWVLESIINLLIAGLMILMGLSLFWYAQRLFISNTVTGDFGLPIYIFVGVFAVGAIVFSLTGLLLTINSVKKVVER